MVEVFDYSTPPFPMRTFFWTCVLALLFLPYVAAQDLAQLRKTIEDTLPAKLPDDLRVVPPEIVAACQKVVDTANQIYTLPNLDEQNKRWTMRLETYARIPLAYTDARTHYARLTVLSDEMDRWGPKEFAKSTEEHVLKLGALLAVQTGNNATNINRQALAQRMVLFAEQYPGADSLSLIDSFLRDVRSMKSPNYRDRRLAEIGPIFQEYYRSINQTLRVRLLDTDIRRATLPGTPMILRGVDLDGREFNLTSMRGKVVLIQFWGTWCIPCRAEMPDLIALHEKYRADGFEIIGINTGVQGDDDRWVRRFLDTTLINGKRITWKILHEGLNKRQNPNRETATDFYGITELPVLILVGRDGNVLQIHPLLSTLDSLIAEALEPQFDWTEEELEFIEERKRKEQEEINQLLERIRSESPAPSR